MPELPIKAIRNGRTYGTTLMYIRKVVFKVEIIRFNHSLTTFKIVFRLFILVIIENTSCIVLTQNYFLVMFCSSINIICNKEKVKFCSLDILIETFL